MKWSEIRIHTSNEAVEPITNIVHEAGISGVVIADPQDLNVKRRSTFGEIFELNPDDYPVEGVYVTFYLPSEEKIEDQLADITKQIKELKMYHIDITPFEIDIREIKEENWATAWKKYYHTIQITDRITIKPMWEDYEAQTPNEMVINLDPGMAFGTGTHPTTRLSIEALEKYVNKNDHVIDVGCGSGVLSIISARLGAKKVHSLDLDEVAVKSTKLNAELNHVLEHLEIQQNDLLKGIEAQANIIVSNILAEIIVKFTEDAYKNLTKDGIFITSGIIDKKQDLVKNSLRDVGFTILETNNLDNWVSIIAQKR